MVRKTPLKKQDQSAIGRRLTLAINNGLKHAVNKFTQPAPKFAHFALRELNPADSNIYTE